MKSRKFYLLLFVLLCIVFLQGSIPAQTPAPETTPTIKSSESVKIETNLVHLGDLIDVDVIGSIEYDWRGMLNPEGFLDGIEFTENPIYALCRTEEEIALDVARAYSKILREPKVVVRILDRSKRPLALLYGAVKTEQRFQIKRPIFLNELIIVSGGLTENTSGEIQIFRPKNLSCQSPSNEKNEASDDAGENRARFVTASQDNGSVYINIKISDLLTGNKEANPQILSGDIITVREAESIYVIGGVSNPKQISSRGQVTLSRAIASAGGLAKGADAKKITVFRREAGETKIIEADLEKIEKGTAEDLILRAFDIVEVEQTGREKRKFPPVLKITETAEKKAQNLPLRIID